MKPESQSRSFTTAQRRLSSSPLPSTDKLSAAESGQGIPEPAQMAEPGVVTVKPTWFTPLRLLFIFCLTNLVVYLDRGKQGMLQHA